MSNARSALGTLFEIDGVAVGGLTNIGGVKLSRDTIDTTNHDVEGGYKTFLGGLREGGDVSLEGHFLNDAGQQALEDNLQGDLPESCVVTFPGGGTWSFSGLVTAFETTAPMDGLIGFSCTVKVSGRPTLAAGVDKSGLRTLVKSANKMEKGDYTTETWSLFAVALIAAQAVMSNTAAAAGDVTTAKTNLENAIEGLATE